jgi:hypothetical protein
MRNLVFKSIIERSLAEEVTASIIQIAKVTNERGGASILNVSQEINKFLII